ncbi:hypothetical protein H257_15239 [Aphanomyces astaci]|uniref:Uncharacterized protein n=1 Tax=Aphanomyces astaci TaxID=112090 RepID=W4FPK5_APHAT|nr:hypothetical protein H257_15239 [Aphanomyces astaci]ETV68886.1 hypothetical protein H257_15239 [Aphanomyces astaci]|eukprot:XP_009841563.1 hypothetical protein H257_15239 [Aphanomyces astaci]
MVFSLFFTAALSVASRQPWFCALSDVAAGRAHCYPFRPNESGDMTTHSYEVTIVWLLGHWHYVVLAIAFNLKDPFRESAWTNRLFVWYTAAVGSLLVVLLLWPGNAMATSWFDFETALPMSFCVQLGGSFALTVVAAVGVETGVHLLFERKVSK